MWKVPNYTIKPRKAELWKESKADLDFFKMVDFASYSNREFYLDAITPATADKLNKFIHFWNSVDDEGEAIIVGREPIKIYIDSFGGSLTAAFTIIDAIKASRTPVYTINIGTTYKESFFVYLAGHRKFAYPRSSFCYEKPQSQHEVVEGQSNYQDFYEKQILELKDLLLDGSKVSESEYEKRQTWWISAEKAYELHLCNEVLRSKQI